MVLFETTSSELSQISNSSEWRSILLVSIWHRITYFRHHYINNWARYVAHEICESIFLLIWYSYNRYEIKTLLYQVLLYFIDILCHLRQHLIIWLLKIPLKVFSLSWRCDMFYHPATQVFCRDLVESPHCTITAQEGEVTLGSLKTDQLVVTTEGGAILCKVAMLNT